MLMPAREKFEMRTWAVILARSHSIGRTSRAFSAISALRFQSTRTAYPRFTYTTRLGLLFLLRIPQSSVSLSPTQRLVGASLEPFSDRLRLWRHDGFHEQRFPFGNSRLPRDGDTSTPEANQKHATRSSRAKTAARFLALHSRLTAVFSDAAQASVVVVILCIARRQALPTSTLPAQLHP